MEEKVYESAASAVLAAVNGWPELPEGECFRFATLSEDGGLALFPGSGSVLESERRYVTGRARQVRALPFTLVCRAAGLTASRREGVAAWLEALGRYLEGLPLSGSEGRDPCLAAYPALSDGRLLAIRRQGAPRLDGETANRSETWVMEMTAKYETVV